MRIERDALQTVIADDSSPKGVIKIDDHTLHPSPSHRNQHICQALGTWGRNSSEQNVFHRSQNRSSKKCFRPTSEATPSTSCRSTPLCCRAA